MIPVGKVNSWKNLEILRDAKQQGNAGIHINTVYRYTHTYVLMYMYIWEHY